MKQKQQALVNVLLADPAVENVSSFIGADGTNTTLNSGRIQINLKPLAQRGVSAMQVIDRLEPKLAEVAGITALYAAGAGSHGRRPGEPHGISVHAGGSRTSRNCKRWSTVCCAKLKRLPQLADVATDQQLGGTWPRP